MSFLPAFGRSTAGYQGAERSGAHVQVYNHVGDPLRLSTGSGAVDFDGKDTERTPPLLQVSVSNALASGGRFSFTMHVPHEVDVKRLVTRNAWCDISFFRFGTSWHVMRGLVDEVRVRREVTGSGASSVTASVSGRSFQKAWETTPCWFNTLNASNYDDGLLRKVSASGLANSSPNKNVESILFRLFDVVATEGRANWQMPATMPGTRGSLTQAVLYDDDYFAKRVLQRSTPTGNLMFPDVNIWQIALQHFAESQFCELYTDILPPTGLLGLANNPGQQAGLPTSLSRMAVVFRDKPFPVVDPKSLGGIGPASPYFRLPLWTMRQQDLMSTDLGVSDYEAFNAFMTVGTGAQGNTAAPGITRFPLWRIKDMQANGMRRLDSGSPYEANIAAGSSDYALYQARRARLRDWYCMGGELEQGSLQLWRCWPEVHVGGRVRVKGQEPDEDFTAYVESVRHQWSPQAGARTSLDVTRGFVGTDKQLLARLGAVSRSYTVAPSKPSPIK